MLTKDMILNYVNPEFVREIENALESAVKSCNFTLTKYGTQDCIVAIDCKWPDGKHMLKVKENMENSGEFSKVKMFISDDKLEVRLTFAKE